MGISCHVFLFNGYFPIWNAYVLNALGAPLFFMYTSLHLDSEIRYTRIMFFSIPQ